MSDIARSGTGALEWIRALWPPIWTLVGGWLVLVFFRWLAPVLTLAIEHEWVGTHQEYLRLRLRLENRSRVPTRLKECRVQLLEHEAGNLLFLSEWVPFEQALVKAAERPVAWAEPKTIENPPETLYPGENHLVELLYRVPRSGILLHAGLQVSQTLPRWRRWLSGQPLVWRQTATAWIVKPTNDGAA
jgi:hypothetical protein